MEELTIKEVIQIVMNQLSGISVPVSMFDSVTVPIRQAIANLNECVVAIDNANRKGEETEESGDE